MRQLAFDDSRPAANPARIVRVLLGSAAAIALAVLGLRGLLQARELSESAAAARPEFLELAYRSGGIALLAAAQVVMVMAVIGAFYPVRRGDRVYASILGAICIVAAVFGVVSGLTGR